MTIEQGKKRMKQMQKSNVIRMNRWKDAKQSVDAGNEKEFQELDDALGDFQ
jgi:hypothetical protein